MNTIQTWENPAVLPCTIDAHKIHVYRKQLSGYTEQQIAELFNGLAPDEQTRALRFHFAKDRHHFIVARAHLRKILAQYLKITPQEINFHYNAYGKPELLDHTLQFNLSHSQDMAVYAISNQYSVGIDIEATAKDHDIAAIAQRFFSASEYTILKNLAPARQKQAFYNAWVRKEAFLKAIGQGLSYSLANVEVTLLPEDAAAFLAIHDENQNITEWSLYELPAIANYVTALAVKGKPEIIKTYAI